MTVQHFLLDCPQLSATWSKYLSVAERSTWTSGC